MPNERKLKRQFTLTKTEEGYVLTPPEHKGLVLSGGGAKGIGYAGMIHSMDVRGTIKGLTHVSGASAGAMTASLLAVGMSSTNISKLVNELDILKLLDRDGLGRLRADGKRFRNVLEIIYLQQMQEHMGNLEEPDTPEGKINFSILQQKLDQYKSFLKKEELVINNIQDIINMTKNREILKKLDAAFEPLPKMLTNQQGERIESPRITFADLGRLRSVLPEADKHLIKNLSVVTTNQSQNQLETYNEKEGNGESIAEKVQQSGAHPLLFTPAQNELGESIADGGIIDNMPTEVLVHLGLKSEEILCAKIEDAAAYEIRVKRAQAHAPENYSGFYWAMDKVAKLWLGASLFKAQAEVINREKVFYHNDNMIYINSGTLKTTTTTPTPKQREDVISSAFEQTEKLLDKQVKVFDNPLIAILYLGVEHLNDLLVSVDASDPLFSSAAQAKAIFLLQNQLILEINENDFSDVEIYLTDINKLLNSSGLDSTQQEQAMALCLKQMNHLSKGKLENYIITQVATEADAQRVSLFTQLLDLLYKPIEWILSVFSSKSSQPVAPILPTEQPEAQKDVVISKLQVLSLLSHKEVHKSPIDTAKLKLTTAKEADKKTGSTQESEQDVVTSISPTSSISKT